MELISNNIKYLRKINKLSQKQVALEIGMAQAQYSRVESGKVVPTIQTLSKIAQVFRVKLGELFKDFKTDENVQDLSLVEKINLLSQLDDEEKQAIIKIIDIAIAKQQMKDNLNQIIAS